MSEEHKKPTWDAIQTSVVADINAAATYVEQTQSADRQERWNRYFGRPLGNEVKGRSQWMSRDVMDVIEWMMPYLLKTFASGDPKIEIEIEGAEPWVNKAMMRRIQDDLSEDEGNSLFIAFYTWMKDALVSDTSVVKPLWHRDHELKQMTWPRMTVEQLKVLGEDPDVEVVDWEIGEERFGSQYVTNVKTRIRAVRDDKLAVDNVPHWEFIAAAKSTSVNDEYGKGHKTTVNLDFLKRINRSRTKPGEKPFFKNLSALEDAVDGDSQDGSKFAGESERNAYMGEDLTDAVDTDTKGAKSEVELVEWFTREDVDGDGYLEDIICWVGNKQLLRWELNTDRFIPFCVLSPILACYKFYGIAYSDLVLDVQNLKTMLVRRILDNFSFTNVGQWVVGPNAEADVRAMLDNVPGDVIRGKLDAVKKEYPKPFHPSVLNLVEYVDTVKENRTGVTRYNQGQAAGSLNRTAAGISMIQGAAHQRLEMVARIFAETGVKDFYRKCAMLYQRFMTRPFTAKVMGREVEITREMIQGRVKTKVNMSAEAEVGIVESQKIERMFTFLGQLNGMFPGLLNPKSVYNLAHRYVAAFGYKETSEFIGELDTFVNTSMEQLKAAADQAMKTQMLEAQKLQGDHMLKNKDLDIKATLGMSELELKRKIKALEAMMEWEAMNRDDQPQAYI